MPLLLGKREPGAMEMMDQPDCDPRKLANTYRQFRYVNAGLSRSGTVYRRWLRPAMAAERKTRLLDIGFGGGDIALAFAAWAERDGYQLEITGIDIDERAVAHARSLNPPNNVDFRHASAAELAAAGERYDLVYSNHLLHHLADGERDELLRDAAILSRGLAIMVDLRRSDLAYALFAVGTLPFFRDSYIRVDGLASLRRSFTPAELRAVAPPGWRVQPLFPFRQVLLRENGP